PLRWGSLSLYLPSPSLRSRVLPVSLRWRRPPPRVKETKRRTTFPPRRAVTEEGPRHFFAEARMASKPLRVGLIGAGANTRSKPIPGLRALLDVEISAVCNRRPASSRTVAREFGIPRIFEHWQDLVSASDIDAVVIGTWPYLHCPITLAALETRKHVLTEARLSMNAAEARRMLQAARAHPELVAQVVPSPFGLKGDRVMRERIQGGFLGELRE